MKEQIRRVLALTTVGLVGGVSLVAASLNPPGTRSWLVVCGLLGAGMAVQAVSSEPRDLIPALLFALVPVVGLVSDGSPWWLGPPLACLILLAGELSVLTWENPAGMADDGSLTSRLREAGLLAVVGLGTAIGLGAFGATGLLGGTRAVLAGSVGLVGVAWAALPRRTSKPQTERGSQFE
jgi:hypothetical protein